MKTNKDYQATFKANMKAEGWVQFHDWCHPDDKPYLRQVCKDLRNKHKREDDENTNDIADCNTDNRNSSSRGSRSNADPVEPDRR